MQIGRFTSYVSLAASPLAATRQLAPPDAAKRAIDGSQDEGTIVSPVPPAPTEEARAMVDRAAERVKELHAANRELHFSQDEDSGRVVIEVRDLDGKLLKTIPPSKALDVMSGGDL